MNENKTNLNIRSCGGKRKINEDSSHAKITFFSKRIEFQITTTWDNRKVDHDPVKIKLSPGDHNTVLLSITAPFFNDPAPPNGVPGDPFPQLWNYEVVEAFFLGRDGKYLEVEFAPRGEHLLLMLSGAGNAIKMCLPCTYTSKIDGDVWYGEATLPSSYFPPAVNLFNAYAIHGVDEGRTYEALYPVPTGHFESPNFHRLEFFRYLDISTILPSNLSPRFSRLWEEALVKKDKTLTC